MTRLHRNLSDVRNYALLVEMILREKMLIMCAPTQLINKQL